MEKKRVKINPNASKFKFAANFYDIVEINNELIINFYFNDGSDDPDEVTTILIEKSSLDSILSNWESMVKNISGSGEKKYNTKEIKWKNKKAVRVFPHSRINTLIFQKMNSIIYIYCIDINPSESLASTEKEIEKFPLIELTLNLNQTYGFIESIKSFVEK